MKAKPPQLARKYRISGRVQGVGFRYFAERAARELGLYGYVRNCFDGSVEAYAIGEAPALDEFRVRLTQGPRGARVEAVDESDESVNAGYRDFVIEGGW